MELTVVRGNATPEELEAVVRALTMRMRETRAREDEPPSWADPCRLARGPSRGRWPLQGDWRLSGWAG
ncbi:acyl-CoA carboxylase subunit epsilon [Nonomuraea sp. H19]|uniref:acyl-CoA carboxylase subunit epsilon n=1 Tax=Nonomuraea sp. H19 TaxID=3452206 RepID=UPI003F8C820F